MAPLNSKGLADGRVDFGSDLLNSDVVLDGSLVRLPSSQISVVGVTDSYC